MTDYTYAWFLTCIFLTFILTCILALSWDLHRKQDKDKDEDRDQGRD